MDDNFTTGPKDDRDQILLAKAAMDDLTALIRSAQKGTDERLRAMQLDLRDMSLTMAALNRNVQRRTPIDADLSPEKQALMNLRHDYVTLAEMYTNVQRRIDRMDQRLDAIEKKLEP